MERYRLIQKIKIVWVLLFAAFAFGFSKGETKIQSGDLIQVTYTCTLPDGQVVTTNDINSVQNKQLPKHKAIFAPRKYYQPAALTVGSGKPSYNFRDLPIPSLEAGIESELSHKLIGESLMQKITIQVSGQPLPKVVSSSRYLKLSRHKRIIPLVKTISKEKYEQSFGKAPKIGSVFKINDALTEEVIAFDKNSVRVKSIAKQNVPVDEGQGSGFYYQKGDYYEFILEPSKGGLMRSLSMIGRITDVDDLMFTIDYGFPFYPEGLQCEVIASPVKTPKTISMKGE